MPALHLLDAGDDDDLALRKPGGDRQSVPTRWPSVTRRICGAVVLVEPEDVGALLVLQDGRGRHHRQLDGSAGLHRHLHELAGHELQLRIGELGVDGDGAGRRIDRVVEEGDLARLVVFGAVGQLQLRLVGRRRRPRDPDCWASASSTTSRYSRSEIEKTTRIGSVCTTVASVPLCGETRLPTVMFALPMRPAMGDLMSV